MKKIAFGKNLKKVGKALLTITLIPYAIATYKELRSVDWMNYWKTIRVTAFVLLFAAIISASVFGLDQGIFGVINFIVQKTQ